MADRPRQSSRPPSNRRDTPHLQYPTFPPLSASVEEWLSRSRPANMTSTRHPDGLHPLSESWATLSTSDTHSEDGAPSEQTDVGSLIDQSGPDDVASLDGRFSSSEADAIDEDEDDDNDNDDDYEDEDEDEDDGRSSLYESQNLSAPFPTGEDPIHESHLSTETAFYRSTDSIEFVEPEKWPEADKVELKHTIQVFEGAEASELKKRLPYNLRDSLLTVTIQQTMTKQSLEVDQPFRVLYLGNPEFRNIILDKIGDVLVSSSCSSYESSSAESSRYHVVPTSFGAGAIPNFAELLPIHVQLIVDECVDASEEPQLDKPNNVTLHFKNRPSCSSSWTDMEYCISSSTEWTLPDVAIFFISTNDDEHAVRIQNLARTFMMRHGTPVIVISEAPLWTMTTELTPINHHSLHMCIESRNPLTGESAVLRRYPIDIKTFESITPRQLNRNLASLASLYPKKTPKVAAKSPTYPQPDRLFDAEKYPKNMKFSSISSRAQEMAPVLRLVTLFLISIVVTSLALTAFKAGSVLLTQQWTQNGTTDVQSFPSGPPKQTALSIKTSYPVDQAQLSTKDKCQSKAEELMSLSLSPHDLQKKSDDFKIQVVGDCHIIIKTPHGFPTRNKRPGFSVSVSRRDIVLPYELSRLFDGVYALRLEREQAHGLVNVTVKTSARPPVEQTAQLDFGTPWLKIENWKRAAQIVSSQLTRDISIAQTGIVEAYGRICTDLQVLMGDAVKRSHFLRHEAELLSRGSIQRTMETRDAVLSKSKELSEVVKRTAVQQFQSASSVLHGKANRENRDATQVISKTWRQLSDSAQRVDLRPWMDYFRKMETSRILERAQLQARSLVLGKSLEDEH
ncbi:hypothetical protein ASPZODRAFT_126936 [Penicilliopsis zonata CBS 506.65]|uniref:Uncharacterized protein n=1 Tax=Penicilliopsis zonata CBS 506.65 TaxID=1073090 RepID=A0A1L9SUT8_9EURO|nr:hypothetical protein ASPZODRAFT_126936 [Penicilliopsis zonata CBS 506.65]OJJ50959.1 hypothetical protein ASPZODRAFT_126936 [Penicilliopsis zonata CBS 506.65]